MKKILEPFQEAGVEFLAANPHALLADEPGLGKSVQAIAAAQKINVRRCLVVCPASVREGWRTELRECLGSDEGWQVLSYNALTSGTPLSAEHQWDLLVLDEAHFLKTIDSQRTQAVFGNDGGIARRARYKWALTGTPVLNRPRELYPLLKTLCPAFADMTFVRFAQRHCGAHWNGREIDTRGASHLDELSEKLRGFMLRRTKREVYPRRKAPILHMVPLDLTAGDLKAVAAEEDAIGGREARLSPSKEAFSQMGDTSRLLRLLGFAKIRQVAGFVDDLLEREEKVVVFAHHRDVIGALDLHFAGQGLRPVVYRGGMTDNQKTGAVALFAGDPRCRVFIGQRQAAGIGINGLQQVCSTAVIAEPSWVPGETQQMIDRLDRIGQMDDLVTAYLLYAGGTLDEVVVKVHDRKRETVRRIVAG